MILLGDKVLLKKIEITQELSSGMVIKSDFDSLPVAEVILVSKEMDIVKKGDKVYYIEPREKGKVKHNGEEHFITPISSIVAII